jgi:Putative transmembrane protein (PGPGW)
LNTKRPRARLGKRCDQNAAKNFLSQIQQLAVTVGHKRTPPLLRAAKRKSKIAAGETGDYSSFSSRGPLPESLMLLRTVEQVRRLSRIVGGFTLLLIGIVMLVTPGPGWLVIFLGLGLLAAEFVWAKRLMDRIKRQGERVRSVMWRTAKNAPDKGSAESNEPAEM